MKPTVPLFAALIAVATPLHATCPQPEEIAAGNATEFKDWDGAYTAFKKYAECDDGFIAEGFSDSVVQLLANRWDQLPALQALAGKDLKFEEFVIRHIDESTDYDQIKQIRASATTSCPKGAGVLCKKIISRIDELSFAE